MRRRVAVLPRALMETLLKTRELALDDAPPEVQVRLPPRSEWLCKTIRNEWLYTSPSLPPRAIRPALSVHRAP